MSDAASDKAAPDTRGATVALVGHCGPDMYALRSAVGGFLEGATVTNVADTASLDRAVADADVLLVNRVLDGSFGTDSGIELIRELASKRQGPRPTLMLVSNYEDAQREAEQVGASPGFGKSAMRDEETGRRLIGAIREARS